MTDQSTSTHQSRTFVDHVGDSSQLADRIEAAMTFIQWKKLIPSNCRVFVKPNLTWRSHLPGVTVTPHFLEAFVRVLKERTSRIIIGESNGGYHGFEAEEAFESHGLYALRDRFGVEVVNLSRIASEPVTGSIQGRSVSVDLPSRLLHEVDVFITLPVPKVHAMTRVSLGFKNQWGCLPSAMRLRHHASFSEKILLINRALKTRIAFFDAEYMLDRTGPMVGLPIHKRLLVASDDIGAGSLACCQIMGIDPWSVRHLRMARAEKMIPAALSDVVLNQPLEPFCTHQFHLRRTLINWVALAAFKNEYLTRLLYDSMFADLSHRVLYTIRRNDFVSRLLYGALGPPQIEGRRR